MTSERTRTSKSRASQRASRKRFSIFFVVLLLLIAIPIGLAFRSQFSQMKALEEKMDSVTQQRDALQTEIASLEQELTTVNSDAFIEKYARENLGMVKKNEIVYEIDSSQPADSASQSTEGNGDNASSTEGSAQNAESSSESSEASNTGSTSAEEASPVESETP